MGGKKGDRRRVSRAPARPERRAKAPREGKETTTPIQPELGDQARELLSPQETAADTAGRWPAHSSNRSLRQAAVLQMQRERGNAQVIKTLSKIARQPDQPEVTIEESSLLEFDRPFYERALRRNRFQESNPPFGPGWPYDKMPRSLWQQGKYDEFTNWVARYQREEMGLPLEEVDGVVGPQTAMDLRFYTRAHNLNQQFKDRLRGWPYDDELRQLWDAGNHKEFARLVRDYQREKMHLPRHWAGWGRPFADGILGEETAAALQRNPRQVTARGGRERFQIPPASASTGIENARDMLLWQFEQVVRRTASQVIPAGTYRYSGETPYAPHEAISIMGSSFQLHYVYFGFLLAYFDRTRNKVVVDRGSNSYILEAIDFALLFGYRFPQVYRTYMGTMEVHERAEERSLEFFLLLLDTTIGLIPIVGDVVDIAELALGIFTGEDRYGRPLSTLDMVLIGIGVALPLVTGSLLAGARRLGRSVGRSADDMMGVARGVRSLEEAEKRQIRQLNDMIRQGQEIPLAERQAAERIVRKIDQAASGTSRRPIEGAEEITVSQAEYERALSRVFPSHHFDRITSLADDVGNMAARLAVANPRFVAAIRRGGRGRRLAGTLFHSEAARAARSISPGDLPPGWTLSAERTIQPGAGGSRADILFEGPQGQIVEFDWKTTGGSAFTSRALEEMERHAGQIRVRISDNLSTQESRSWIDYVRPLLPDENWP